MTMAVNRVPSMRSISTHPNGFLAARSIAVGLARVFSLTLSTAYAAPLSAWEHSGQEEPEAEGASLWVLYVASLVLVLSGGAFAGLTIALMGQDGIYLQVMARDPSEPQQKNAKRVYDLLKKGKHWVLVTLLLANVIVNESLPVVLDRCLGGGVAAVVGATFLIVIFGEVLPQSICVRYGLQIGGYMSKPVIAMMYLMAPIAWPMAKLLDKLLGEDHGTVYKKSGLKTLVTLHKNLGEVSQRLNQDEVTIISAVLDLKEKPVANVMTPMADVFVMSEDTVLDEQTMDMILTAGYSRIPIHETGNPTNFVGMLLVKILITYDPEDCKLVRDFPLATLPETRPETSCLDIVNFFQEGKSHMVLVSEYPGEDHGALGVVTLEDVIEELIGEEIIDESDVYIDVHKAIRRLAPAPKARVQRRQSEDQAGKSGDYAAAGLDDSDALRRASETPGLSNYDTPILSGSPKTATLMMRRSSAGVDGQFVKTAVPVRANFEDIREHLKHLGPSNPATNPKKTQSTTVKIKPGTGAHSTPQARAASISDPTIQDPRPAGEEEEEGDETTGLLKPQVTGKDGIQALRKNYGSVSPALAVQLDSPANGAPPLSLDEVDQADKSTQTPYPVNSSSPEQGMEAPTTTAHQRASSSGESAHSLRVETNSNTNNNLAPKRANVRSGSITENVIESRGVRKVVLETSSNDDEDLAVAAATPVEQHKPLSRSTFGLFTRDGTGMLSSKDQDQDQRKGAGKSQVDEQQGEEDEEEEEEGVMSPDPGDEEASGSRAAGDGVAKGAGGNGGGKKKNRRKKPKGESNWQTRVRYVN
ncbi:Protein MAM3 [Madurella mycetomatis]|uniref:Protein MAM3 n=1 Tax=Madurella mycetomatis TaxID=100816 RepID=A0A175VNN0_9PEZI|nr:Protein MAM3 [Madurella mycetomatis]